MLFRRQPEPAREWRRVAPEPQPEPRSGGWLARLQDPERLPAKDFTGARN